jgi:hypothetical protein
MQQSPEEAQDQHLWRRAIVLRMDKLEEKLAQNTEATQRVDTSTRELVDILTSWKGAMKVIEFLGKLAKPLAAMVALAAAVLTWKWQK